MLAETTTVSTLQIWALERASSSSSVFTLSFVDAKSFAVAPKSTGLSKNGGPAVLFYLVPPLSYKNLCTKNENTKRIITHAQ